MNKELISRYFKGEVTAIEYASVKAWIEKQGADWMDDYIQKQWDVPTINTAQSEKDQMAEKVFIAIKEQYPIEPVIISPYRTLMRKQLRWVAAACLLIVTGAIWWQFSQQKMIKKRELTWQTIRNDSIGTIKQVYLPDSSLVTLNTYSFVRFANNYNDTTREIELTGEAFFDVRHDKKRPFVVHAGYLSTRVYGTRFNISAYPEASQLRVALQSGSIGVHGINISEQVLQPGEQLRYDNKDRTTHIDRQPAYEMGNWVMGKLTFHKVPLTDVLYSLEKKYGVKFGCVNHLKNPIITASFEKVTLQRILQHLSFIGGIEFQQIKDSIQVR